MNNKQFVDKLYHVARNYNTLYVMGCFGAPLVTKPFDNIERYTTNDSYNKRVNRAAMIRKVADSNKPYFGFDCSGLIKGLLWGWSGDVSKRYGGANYCADGIPDSSADALISKCYGVSNDFSNIVVGEVVWKSGHIGVYIGDGLVVECTPEFKNCVQVTAVKNLGTKTGYNHRTWTKHGRLPYVTYTDKPTKTLEDVAKDVIRGVYGNEPERSKRLTAAGYNAEDIKTIRSIVNKIL